MYACLNKNENSTTCSYRYNQKSFKVPVFHSINYLAGGARDYPPTSHNFNGHSSSPKRILLKISISSKDFWPFLYVKLIVQ